MPKDDAAPAADIAKQPKDEASAPAKSYPAAIVLQSPHGFVDGDGNHRFWNAGMKITAPAEVAMLVDRGADFAPVDA